MIKIPEKILDSIKKPKTLVIFGLIGIFLIFLSSLSGDNTEESAEMMPGQLNLEEYRESLEENIADMVTDITGSRKVKVIVTLDSGVRYSYADTREESSSDKTEKEAQVTDSEIKEGYITVKSASGGEEALLLKTEMPEIRGVAVVCEGGDNEYINEKIVNTITAALNITSKRVYICGRNAK